MTDDGVPCIRCDEPTAHEYPRLNSKYVMLTFNHEIGALPICMACFEEVRDRDFWD
jgi:hypothetical protein